jgi:hypothetical protein
VNTEGRAEATCLLNASHCGSAGVFGIELIIVAVVQLSQNETFRWYVSDVAIFARRFCTAFFALTEKLLFIRKQEIPACLKLTKSFNG